MSCHLPDIPNDCPLRVQTGCASPPSGDRSVLAHNRNALLVAMLLPVPAIAAAEARIDYVFTSEQTTAGRPPVLGNSKVTSTIDGPSFRNESRLGRSIELSEDDGRTTYFGRLHTTPQTPLIAQAGDVFAPIVGTLEDEKIVIGDSVAGPPMFGLPTRVYTVDYRYAIAARVAYVFRSRSPSHARLTFTVADIGISAAALRVAFSRGYGYAIAQHAEAFTGLPLIIDGTIEAPSSTVHVHVEAEALQR